MFRTILIAVDGSYHADAAVRAGVEIAKAGGADVHVCHVLSIPEQYKADLADQVEDALLADGRKMLELAAKQASNDGIEVKTKLIQREHPAEAIVSHATEIGADLIVVGVRGRSKDSLRAVGSVSQAVAHEAPCSVLLIRS